MSRTAFSTLGFYISVPMHSFVVLRNPLPVFKNQETLIRRSGARLIIKMSFQYKNSDYKGKTASRPSYLYNWNPIPGKTVFILRRGPRVSMADSLSMS